MPVFILHIALFDFWFGVRLSKDPPTLWVALIPFINLEIRFF